MNALAMCDFISRSLEPLRRAQTVGVLSDRTVSTAHLGINGVNSMTVNA